MDLRVRALASVCGVAAGLVAYPALADDASTGPDGVNAQALHALGLTGRGVRIGMVEPGRPGWPNPPGIDNAANSNPDVVPERVWEQIFAPVANRLAFGNPPDAEDRRHGTLVAGTMISRGNQTRGVARDASLLASADTGPDGTSTSLSVQHLTDQGRLRALNLSFSSSGTADGSSLRTRFLDWSARTTDTLYVVAGPEGTDGLRVPSDAMNGMTVSYTRRNGAAFREIDPDNQFFESGGRRTVSITAPGASLRCTDLNNATVTASGTSLAAPHVTGTVALLQSFSEGNSRFNANAARHEVMKAVLMNSADKRDGVLGSTKTITRTDGNDWIQQRAAEANRDTIPLDSQMGTGQLNALSALRQFSPGEQNPGAVPQVGWDFSPGITANASAVYSVTPAFAGGDWVAVTLVWDRGMTLVNAARDRNGVIDNARFDGETFRDDNSNDVVDPNEPFQDLNGDGALSQNNHDEFTPAALNNLDLFLMPRGETDTARAVARSTSTLYNVEHIFFQLGADQGGRYDILVRHAGGLGQTQPYAVAWIPAPSGASAAFILVALAAGRRRR